MAMTFLALLIIAKHFNEPSVFVIMTRILLFLLPIISCPIRSHQHIIGDNIDLVPQAGHEITLVFFLLFFLLLEQSIV